MPHWERLEELVRIDSDWVTLAGERWRTGDGSQVDYWRVEKADSVIVLPIQAGQILCAAPTFRPGVGCETLDLPGGRLPAGQDPADIVAALLHRELGIEPFAIEHLEPLNTERWLVNSSFSNQGLWAFTARIDADFEIPASCVGATADADRRGCDALLARVDCLQCRAVLLEWLRRQA